MIQVGMLAAMLATAALALAEGPTLKQAHAALQAGEADKALQLLASLPPSAEAHNLRCRVELTLQQWNAAADECQQAVNMDGSNSDYHMWLGRALGEKADRASFLSAYSLAKRVRREFEAAVHANPRNAAALSDLGEFYYSAPGIVGGGDDKAESVAKELDRIDKARAHELRGRIAESQKDYGTAERELKEAIAASAHPAFQWMTLASFYRNRKRWTDMEAAVQSGAKAALRDKQAGVALSDGASLLIKTRRNPELAAKMLEDYLAESSKSEQAPAFVAYTRLAQLKAQLGDKAEAQKDRQVALALAHDYQPARNLRF